MIFIDFWVANVDIVNIRIMLRIHDFQTLERITSDGRIPQVAKLPLLPKPNRIASCQLCLIHRLVSTCQQVFLTDFMIQEQRNADAN